MENAPTEILKMNMKKQETTAVKVDRNLVSKVVNKFWGMIIWG